jgi:glycosyltransferase involved in cell wall biosynthesis
VIIAGGPHCGLRSDSILGGEIYERRLIAALALHGVRVKVGLPRSRPLDKPLAGAEATLLRPGRGLRWPIAPLAFVPYTVRLLRKDEVDLLRGHDVLHTGPSLFVGRSLARKRVPIILHHLHTDATWAWLEALVLRRADAVVTISESSRRQLLEFGVDPGRVHVAQPGVDGPPEHVEPWPDAWPSGDALKLLFVGRLIERKRPQLAIRALDRLLDKGTAASLVVAGHGPRAKDLRGLTATCGLRDRVALLGPIPEHEKWGLLAAADVFLFPSELEGFGFAAAEAQRAGVPVVAAGGTAASEVVVHGKTGFVVAGEPEAFARAIAQLADPIARREMGERARLLSRRFDWNASAARVAEIYAQVVDRFES